jgi:FAD/FMN-containing dehydrogenase
VIGLTEALEAEVARAIDDGFVTDAAIAGNEAQRAALWRLRESMSEAQKFEGSSIKHDVSVPITSIPQFLREGIAAVTALVPGVRPVPFGHVGDGNIHFNFSVPMGGDNDAYLARWSEVSRAVHDLVQQFGGSISAEHGRRNPPLQERCRTRRHAGAEADARPEQHPQSGQSGDGVNSLSLVPRSGAWGCLR